MQHYDAKKIRYHFERAMALKGWSKADLAYKGGVVPETVSRVLSGTTANTRTVATLADKLGVPLSAIVRDPEPDEALTARKRT